MRGTRIYVQFTSCVYGVANIGIYKNGYILVWCLWLIIEESGAIVVSISGLKTKVFDLVCNSIVYIDRYRRRMVNSIYVIKKN